MNQATSSVYFSGSITRLQNEMTQKFRSLKVFGFILKSFSIQKSPNHFCFPLVAILFSSTKSVFFQSRHLPLCFLPRVAPAAIVPPPRRAKSPPVPRHLAGYLPRAFNACASFTRRAPSPRLAAPLTTCLTARAHRVWPHQRALVAEARHRHHDAAVPPPRLAQR